MEQKELTATSRLLISNQNTEMALLYRTSANSVVSPGRGGRSLATGRRPARLNRNRRHITARLHRQRITTTSHSDMDENQTEDMDLTAFEQRERQWRIALADAIRTPMGIIPTSAIGLVDATDLAQAEWRRMGKSKSNEARPY